MPRKSKKPTFIHVHQQRIRQNLKDGENRPVITAKQGSKNDYGHEADIKCSCCGDVVAQVIYVGPGRVKPLIPCGARVAIVVEPENGTVEVRMDDG